MFRFKIIDQKKAMTEIQAIDLVAKKFKCYQEMKIFLNSREDSILILAEKDEKLVGGAFLLKQELKNIQEDVRELVTTLSWHNYIWECSMVCFENTDEQMSLVTPESKYYSQSFYRGLYEGFVEFGRIREVGFLVMKLTPEAYESTKIFGFWPYVVELRPDHSFDGRFHGILPLTGSQYKAYRKSWEAEHKH
ncbi:MAG TPA: hypothetical protein VMW10_11710 [Alphaproteobacteria bacterium]|nr:hypothetical protein [Alphaproteobacteria bacterium]